jgi:ABC-type iron transport system FetAB permease component
MTSNRKRLLSRENIGIFCGLVISLVLAIIADRRGMPHKWYTAIFGTTVPFGVVILSYPLRWKRSSFWAALTICLVIHTVAIWAFFEDVLSNTQTFGLLLWLPVAFIETFVLLAAVRA